MTSYGSVEYVLDKRHLPRSQVEAIPIDDIDYTDDEAASSLNASSLRANFLPPGTPLPDVDQADINRYGSYHEQSPYFSPVFANLPSVDHTKLMVSSEETQKLRRKLLRGSNILIVQGGYLGKMFIYNRLKQLGVNIYVMDGPDSVWKKAAEDDLIVDFIPLDFTENDTIFQRAMDSIIDLHHQVKFDAVTTYFEDAVALAARIATALNMEVNPVEACDKARNKRKTREVMAESGLPVPKFKRILCEQDLKQASEYVGFPVILKPVFGAASAGVTKAHSYQELLESYRKLFATFDVTQDTIWAQGTEMVIEEYYDGDEFDIDIMLSDGIPVYAKVSDNWACWEPWFQETGTNCPSLYAEDKQKELIRLSIDTTIALGFKYGCFHVECKYTSRGPRLIEVNARMGGVSVRDVNMHAWGIDLVEEHAMCALRIPIRPNIPEKPLAFMAESAINAPYSGIINDDHWLDFALEHPLVHKINYFKQKGDQVVGPEDGVPDWICEIITLSYDNQKEAVNIIRSIIEEQAKVPITPKSDGKTRGFFFPSHAHPFLK